MAHNMTQVERQLDKVIEKLPFGDEYKATWSERLHNGEMGEELAEEIRKTLSDIPEENLTVNAETRARYLVEIAALVRRWRLTNQARNFGRR